MSRTGAKTALRLLLNELWAILCFSKNLNRIYLCNFEKFIFLSTVRIYYSIFEPKKWKQIQKMPDFIGFSEHMQAHFEKKFTFFGRKLNKVPCIIGSIWGKINFLGIFCVKPQWIIGQKSQNRARYADEFWEKFTFFGRKVI